MRMTWIAATALASALITGALSASVRGSEQSDQKHPAETTEIAALPDDPAKTLVAERCLVCHGAGLITQQHKDAAAWGRTVTQMRTWGTPIQDDDQKAIVAYLAEHFGPKAGPNAEAKPAR